MALSKCWRAAKNSEGLGTTVKLWSNFGSEENSLTKPKRSYLDHSHAKNVHDKH